MPTLSVVAEEAFALTSRVTGVRLREQAGPGPLRGQDVRLAPPGRDPLTATVIGLQFVDGPDDSIVVALTLCGAAASDVPPGTRISFEWYGAERDETGLREALRGVLEDEGYQVKTAPDGEALWLGEGS